ncbi:MAG: hypothetical protein ACPGLY_00830 [Rubripirellula sp.]
MRLRSPWKIDRNDGLGLQRCDLPDVIAGTSPAEYRRTFNRPTGMVPGQRIWLSVHDWKGVLESLTINGHAAEVGGNRAPCQVDISNCLEDHNLIELRLVAAGDVQPRLIGPVELGIQSVD